MQYITVKVEILTPKSFELFKCIFDIRKNFVTRNVLKYEKYK